MQNVDGYGVIREYHSKTLLVGIISTNGRMYFREHTSQFQEYISKNILPSSKNIFPRTYFRVPRMYFREYTSEFREYISENILPINILPCSVAVYLGNVEVSQLIANETLGETGILGDVEGCCDIGDIPCGQDILLES